MINILIFFVNKKIKFVYFDVGGVAILDFSNRGKWQDLMGSLVELPKNKQEEFANIFKEIQPKLCTNEKNLDDFVETAKYFLGDIFPSRYNMLNEFLDRFEINIGIQSVISKIEKDFKVGLLTNMYPDMLSGIQKKNLLPSAEWSTIVDSSIIGMKKPDDNIYTYAQEQAKFASRHLLFIDNREDNLATARKHGWSTILYDPTNSEASDIEILSLLY